MSASAAVGEVLSLCCFLLGISPYVLLALPVYEARRYIFCVLELAVVDGPPLVPMVIGVGVPFLSLCFVLGARFALRGRGRKAEALRWANVLGLGISLGSIALAGFITLIRNS